MKTNLRFLLLIFTLSLSSNTFAQDTSDSLFIIETKDGNEFIGTILSQDEERIQFLTNNLGEITIQRLDVKTTKSAGRGRFVNGKYWYENPHASHYLLAPSGYGLRKGEGYYQNGLVIINLVTYGFTDRLSLKVGVLPFTIFDSYEHSPFIINPQFNFPIQKDKWNFSTGILYINSIGGNNYFRISGLESGANIGILYGGLTLGSNEKNLTLSLGYGYDGFSKADLPVVTLSGTLRISRRSYLITENYFLGIYKDRYNIFSFGGRYAARRIAFDYGLFAYLEKNYYSNTTLFFTVVAPWLGLTVSFGKK